MKLISRIVIGIVIGLLFGLWFGVNIGKDKPIFSNPFEEQTIQGQIKKSSEKLLEKSGDVLEKGGKALKDKAKGNSKPAEPVEE